MGDQPANSSFYFSQYFIIISWKVETYLPSSRAVFGSCLQQAFKSDLRRWRLFITVLGIDLLGKMILMSFCFVCLLNSVIVVVSFLLLLVFVYFTGHFTFFNKTLFLLFLVLPGWKDVVLQARLWFYESKTFMLRYHMHSIRKCTKIYINTQFGLAVA